MARLTEVKVDQIVVEGASERFSVKTPSRNWQLPSKGMAFFNQSLLSRGQTEPIRCLLENDAL